MKQRAGLGLALLAVLVLVGVRCGHRPSFLPLATSVYGPSLGHASTVLLFLHGHGGSIGASDWVADDLRKRGLARDTAMVLVNGPFTSFPGRSWGVAGQERDESVARLRALIAGWRRDQPSLRVVVAGFSRGADLAVRLAAAEPAVSGLVALSGCGYEDVPLLAARTDVRVTVAHASDDQLCNVEYGRSLVAQLKAAGREVTYLEHKENHTIPPAALDALLASVAP